MKKTALAIMAAGIGSRFGKGIKQLAPVGPNGEIIMDYSIHDALEAGFDKIVFIIRKDLEEDFKRIIGDRIAKITEVQYVYQSLDDLPDGFSKPDERTKPWGTGQAVLCCKDAIREPFAVINADDYYGKDAYVKIHDYLVGERDSQDGVDDICMAGFVLRNTLSENGGVTRGHCHVDENSNMTRITEVYDIVEGMDASNTKKVAIGRDPEGNRVEMDLDCMVSMNIWGFQPEFLKTLEEGFVSFLSGIEPGDLKKEYLLPIKIGELLKEGKAKVKVLRTDSQWFGVTYQEDRESVVKAIQGLVDAGVYQPKLFV